MAELSFRKTVDLLSKSSPEAVSTPNRRPSPARKLKRYLHVKTDIEKDLRNTLEAGTEPEKIIFVCGSSGDGKSELLGRVFKQYSDTFDFHLDATHSFSPEKDAIGTLNEKFSEHKSNARPLVVGVNIGMLGNYAAAASVEHADIVDSMNAFLDGDATPPNHIYLNFEDYPKFVVKDGQVHSPFVSELIERITAESDKNPLFVSYSCETEDSRLRQNYRMLQRPEVQQTLVRTLLNSQLKFDQFLTARTILDFIHQLLTGPGYLFDNLFRGTGTDLAVALRHFDPCTLRSKQIDVFLVQNTIGITDTEFDEFKAALDGIDVASLKPGSWLRLFYMFQDIEIANNFHQRFRDDFRNELVEKYLQIWLLHDGYSDQPEERASIRRFYDNELTKALLIFANRFSPRLTDTGELLLDVLNGYVMSAKADLKVSRKRIADTPRQPLSNFNACLRLGEEDLKPIAVSVNFYELIRRINRGYRPNKHDKNNIVIFEEVIDDMVRRVRSSDDLQIHLEDQCWKLRNDPEEDEIHVEG